MRLACRISITQSPASGRCVEMELSIEGAFPGLSEQDLLDAGWVQRHVRDSQVAYQRGNAGAIAREGRVVEVIGDSLHREGVEILHRGMYVSPSRKEILERLRVSAEPEQPLVSAHRPERLNFEGIGLVVLVEESRILRLILDAKLLQFGNERRRVAGWWYVVSKPPPPQNSPG